ncbi:hypothetical protein B0H19DRAFT_1079458 [Mycena capillaripes]|nr:hypothetical protein B0H19DRAFT_1079458 [Mycena capillaripes]
MIIDALYVCVLTRQRCSSPINSNVSQPRLSGAVFNIRLKGPNDFAASGGRGADAAVTRRVKRRSKIKERRSHAVEPVARLYTQRIKLDAAVTRRDAVVTRRQHPYTVLSVVPTTQPQISSRPLLMPFPRVLMPTTTYGALVTDDSVVGGLVDSSWLGEDLTSGFTEGHIYVILEGYDESEWNISRDFVEGQLIGMWVAMKLSRDFVEGQLIGMWVAMKRVDCPITGSLTRVTCLLFGLAWRTKFSSPPARFFLEHFQPRTTWWLVNHSPSSMSSAIAVDPSQVQSSDLSAVWYMCDTVITTSAYLISKIHVNDTPCFAAGSFAEVVDYFAHTDLYGTEFFEIQEDGCNGDESSYVPRSIHHLRQFPPSDFPSERVPDLDASRIRHNGHVVQCKPIWFNIAGVVTSDREEVLRLYKIEEPRLVQIHEREQDYPQDMFYMKFSFARLQMRKPTICFAANSLPAAINPLYYSKEFKEHFEIDDVGRITRVKNPWFKIGHMVTDSTNLRIVPTSPPSTTEAQHTHTSAEIEYARPSVYCNNAKSITLDEIRRLNSVAVRNGVASEIWWGSTLAFARHGKHFAATRDRTLNVLRNPRYLPSLFGAVKQVYPLVYRSSACQKLAHFFVVVRAHDAQTAGVFKHDLCSPDLIGRIGEFSVTLERGDFEKDRLVHCVCTTDGGRVLLPAVTRLMFTHLDLRNDGAATDYVGCLDLPAAEEVSLAVGGEIMEILDVAPEIFKTAYSVGTGDWKYVARRKAGFAEISVALAFKRKGSWDGRETHPVKRSRFFVSLAIPILPLENDDALDQITRHSPSLKSAIQELRIPVSVCNDSQIWSYLVRAVQREHGFQRANYDGLKKFPAGKTANVVRAGAGGDKVRQFRRWGGRGLSPVSEPPTRNARSLGIVWRNMKKTLPPYDNGLTWRALFIHTKKCLKNRTAEYMGAGAFCGVMSVMISGNWTPSAKSPKWKRLSCGSSPRPTVPAL